MATAASRPLLWVHHAEQGKGGCTERCTGRYASCSLIDQATLRDTRPPLFLLPGGELVRPKKKKERYKKILSDIAPEVCGLRSIIAHFFLENHSHTDQIVFFYEQVTYCNNQTIFSLFSLFFHYFSLLIDLWQTRRGVELY